MNRLRSSLVATAASSGCVKLGQPVPLSNLVSEAKSGLPQPAQTKVPERFSAFSGLVPARSVPCLRSTWNCCGRQALAPFLVGALNRKLLRRRGVTAEQAFHGLASAPDMAAGYRTDRGLRNGLTDR